jgi:glycosyltransferase involved in cell wall biosynthesis
MLYELETVEAVVQAIRARPVQDVQIIVVDDRSTDGSPELLQSKPPGWVDKILFRDQNQGRGAALRTGFQSVTGDFVIAQHADLEYDPREHPLLLAPLIENRADVVCGSRFLSGRPHGVVYFWHMVGNRLLTLLCNIFTNLNLTDMESCYKVCRREVIRTGFKSR